MVHSVNHSTELRIRTTTCSIKCPNIDTVSYRQGLHLFNTFSAPVHFRWPSSVVYADNEALLSPSLSDVHTATWRLSRFFVVKWTLDKTWHPLQIKLSSNKYCSSDKSNLKLWCMCNRPPIYTIILT